MKRSARRHSHSKRVAVKRTPPLAPTFPTQDQIEAAKTDLDAVIAFFQRRRQFLDTLSTAGDSGRGAKGDQIFDTLFDHAKHNPALAMAFGMRSNGDPQSDTTTDPDDDHRRARALCEMINSWI